MVIGGTLAACILRRNLECSRLPPKIQPGHVISMCGFSHFAFLPDCLLIRMPTVVSKVYANSLLISSV